MNKIKGVTRMGSTFFIMPKNQRFTDIFVIFVYQYLNKMVMEKKKKGHIKQLMKIDWKSIRNKAKAHASISEICAFFGISRTTLYDRCIKDNGITLPEFMEESKDLGRLMLKEAMFQTAIEGNVSQQIYLSKNWLGYKDKHDVTTNEESINKPVIQVINDEMARDVKDFIDFVSKKKEDETD